MDPCALDTRIVGGLRVLQQEGFRGNVRGILARPAAHQQCRDGVLEKWQASFRLLRFWCQSAAALVGKAGRLRGKPCSCWSLSGRLGWGRVNIGWRDKARGSLRLLRRHGRGTVAHAGVDRWRWRLRAGQRALGEGRRRGCRVGSHVLAILKTLAIVLERDASDEAGLTSAVREPGLRRRPGILGWWLWERPWVMGCSLGHQGLPVKERIVLRGDSGYRRQRRRFFCGIRRPRTGVGVGRRVQRGLGMMLLRLRGFPGAGLVRERRRRVRRCTSVESEVGKHDVAGASATRAACVGIVISDVSYISRVKHAWNAACCVGEWCPRRRDGSRAAVAAVAYVGVPTRRDRQRGGAKMGPKEARDRQGGAEWALGLSVKGWRVAIRSTQVFVLEKQRRS